MWKTFADPELDAAASAWPDAFAWGNVEAHRLAQAWWHAYASDEDRAAMAGDLIDGGPYCGSIVMFLSEQYSEQFGAGWWRRLTACIRGDKCGVVQTMAFRLGFEWGFRAMVRALDSAERAGQALVENFESGESK